MVVKDLFFIVLIGLLIREWKTGLLLPFLEMVVLLFEDR